MKAAAEAAAVEVVGAKAGVAEAATAAAAAATAAVVSAMAATEEPNRGWEESTGHKIGPMWRTK